MKNDDIAGTEPPVGPLKLGRRSPIDLDGELVITEVSEAGITTLRPRFAAVDIVHWAGMNKSIVKHLLLQRGALLFRGFSIATAAVFERLLEALADEVMDYEYRSTPRSNVTQRIFTSTEYTQARAIPLHNEMSYSSKWPMLLLFFCLTPAEFGGRTPIADSRKVYARIPQLVKERFSEHGLIYSRMYSDSLDLGWPEVFQAGTPTEVEAKCRKLGITWEWQTNGRLLTREKRPSTARHPVLGDTVWFNQAHLFHSSTTFPSGEGNSLSAAEMEDLPRNVVLGDGTQILDEDISAINAAYRDCAISFDWQRGDVLVLDNMLYAHGREAYGGIRRILVGMGSG